MVHPGRPCGDEVLRGVFLLHIDGPTQEARLTAHDALNPPGRTQAARQQIRDGRAVFQERMLWHGAIAVDGTAPSAVVADGRLALAAGLEVLVS